MDKTKSTILVAAFPLIVAPMIIIQQIYNWLKMGFWREVSIADSLNNSGVQSNFSTDWVGINKIITWLTELPLSLAAFLFALIWFYAIIKISDISDALIRRRIKKTSLF